MKIYKNYFMVGDSVATLNAEYAVPFATTIEKAIEDYYEFCSMCTPYCYTLEIDNDGRCRKFSIEDYIAQQEQEKQTEELAWEQHCISYNESWRNGGL